jgi:hypothetical protein
MQGVVIKLYDKNLPDNPEIIPFLFITFELIILFQQQNAKVGMPYFT